MAELLPGVGDLHQKNDVTGTEIILCTMGTRGDILPFVALARELSRRGHHPTLLANENWGELVTRAGIAFHAIAPKDPSQSGRDAYRFFVENTLPSFTESFDYVRNRVRGHTKPLLVYRSNMLGMECAAEKFALRHVKIALQPAAIRSLDRPPWPMTALAQGRLKGLFKFLVMPAIQLAAEFSMRYRRHSNDFRRSQGLVPYRFGELGMRTADATLVLTPKWFAMPQPDWPRNTHCVGFPFYDQETPDIEVERFTAEHGMPIVFAPGTGVTDVTKFRATAEAICERLHMPVIVLCAVGRTAVSANPCILYKEFIDMGWLLRRSRLLIHHGGIGTTAQALRAGLPQIIVPHGFDQPDNAFRIATLGLGAAVMKGDLDAETWSEIIQVQLQTQRIRMNLEKVSAAIRKEKAMDKAANVIESVATPEAIEGLPMYGLTRNS